MFPKRILFHMLQTARGVPIFPGSNLNRHVNFVFKFKAEPKWSVCLCLQMQSCVNAAGSPIFPSPQAMRVTIWLTDVYFKYVPILDYSDCISYVYILRNEINSQMKSTSTDKQIIRIDINASLRLTPILLGGGLLVGSMTSSDTHHDLDTLFPYWK